MISFTLRPFCAADKHSLALHANNHKVWLGVRDIFPYPYSVTDAEAFIGYAMQAKSEKIFAIDINGEAIGAAGLHLKDDVLRLNGEIGYWLGEKFHNKGIATGVVAELVKMAFNEHGLLRVYAEVFSNNSASGRVLEKNGFELEAQLKNAVVKNSEILDMYIYSRLNNARR